LGEVVLLQGRHFGDENLQRNGLIRCSAAA